MAFTVENRKTEYFNLIAKRGEQLYSEWVKGGISSKTITKTANDLAFEQSLKKSFACRIDFQIYIYALEKRIKHNYGGFLSKLFHPFKYRSELSTLRRLKRVLGFKSDTDSKDIIAVETERLAIIVSKKVDEDDDTEGGLISQLTEPTIEEELEAFLELEEEMLKQANDKIERKFFFKQKEDKKNAKSPTDKVEKGKNSVKSAKTPTKKTSTNTPTEEKKVENKGKEQSIDKDKVKTAKKKEENLSTKTSSIIPEAMGLGLTKKEDSPFPVFKEEVASENLNQVAKNTEEDKNQPLNKTFENKQTAEKEAISIDSESERAKVFPVFGKVDHTKIHPVFRDKPSDANKNGVGEKNNVAKGEEVSNGASKVQPIKISEENLARREVNNNLSKEQIVALAEQIKEQAQIELDRDDEEMRQRINVKIDGVENRVNAQPNEVKNYGGNIENGIQPPQNANK